MYDKIIVPLDGSELAELALPFAEEVAGRLGSVITLVHVGEPSEEKLRRVYEFYMQKMIEGAKEAVAKHLKKGKEVKIESTILTGNAADEIINFAEKEKADLIVMASHGHSGIKRLAVGSVAEKVVRSARRPVALIKVKARSDLADKKSLLKTAVVPLNGTRESEAVIPYITELAAGFEAEIALLFVVGVDMDTDAGRGYDTVISAEKYLGDVGDGLKRRGIAVKNVVRSGAPPDEIIKYAIETHADLIAMSTHSVGRWTFGNVADRVLRGGKTAVLLVKAPRSGAA